MSKQVLLESWLKLLCQMVPGINQAILKSTSVEHTESQSAAFIQWPDSAVILDDVKSAANLADTQKKSVTTTLTSGQSNDASVDMVIALPLKGAEDYSATLAILVHIKPSQQAVVMQVLHWGENWLGLLLQQKTMIQPTDPQAQEVREVPELEGDDSAKPKNRSRLIAIGVLVVVLLLSIVPGTYRVTAPANLEGKLQRVIVAPYDGYIANAFARAGETVKSGDVIAELDTRELHLEKQRYAAEKNEYTRQYRQALSSREQAQAHIFKSQVRQADAQLNLLDKKIERSQLVAALDGVIITGDLSRSLGAPVKTGDVLFEVAPLDEYRLIILVDEKQVVDVQHGMRGALTLKALSDKEQLFTVDKVSPVFEENVTGISYRVEAILDENLPSLRPGMQGVAKIEIEQRSYLWIYLHELFDVIRLWLWRWLP